jgi:hypothetical protein
MNYPIEWKYFSGRRTTGEHWHYVEIRKRDKYARHWSVDGKFYEDTQEMSSWDNLEIETPQFHYYFHPTSQPIEHRIPGMYYVSWPKVTDGITEAWMDHQQVMEVGSNWEWLGCNLNCGMTLMAAWRPEFKYCDLTFNNKTIEVKCMLDGRHFYVYDLGMYLAADDTQLVPPSTQSIVHKPRNGRPYSEWAVDIIAKGGIIGRGFREKTFKEM